MQKSQGFSLLEVLVAFAFFALAGTALYGVFSGALRNAAAAEDYTRAVLIAESRLAELGIGKALALGAESGQVEGEKFRWTLEIRPFRSAAADKPAAAAANAAPLILLGANLVEVEMVVSWAGPRGTVLSVSLDTLRLAPKE